MFESLRARWVIVIIATALGLLFTSPNFIKFGEDSWLGKNRMTLGLDIQGGLHLVMGVDVESYLREQLSMTSRELQNRFKEDGIQIQSSEVGGEKHDMVVINAVDEKAKDAVLKYINDFRGSELQVLSSTGTKVELRFFDAAIIERRKQVVEQAIEVIRNRVNEFGVAEPSVTAQGDNRILVQLPGIQDSAAAKELINRTAKLTFNQVSMDLGTEKLQSLIKSAEEKGKFQLGGEDKEKALAYTAYIRRLNDDLKADLPKDTKLVFEKLDSAVDLQAGRQPFLVKTDSDLNGSHLEDARVMPDEFGKPEVAFRFKPEGRKLFADLTSKAAGGYLAIVLDDVVKSAPSVRETIDSESARITLGGGRDHKTSLNEATFIATALRAGALPATLEQLEERTVGPSLGGDAVEKGKNAAVIGTLVVFVFLAFYYRTGGVIADIALMLNFLLTFAILSSLGATLTLPGIAGFALTVGMSVDANIVIFERIRDQLRLGASQTAALKDGFQNSYAAVLDSNITAILTCIVLVYFGTGPIRGFAVSLMTGITCSMFTAVFVSRVMLDTLIVHFKLNIFSVKRELKHG